LLIYLRYTKDMEKRRGRPPLGSDRTKGEYLDVRLETAEKRSFKDAAELAGIPLATWVRERLRRAARNELEEANLKVHFLYRAKP
jgi:hypothetical protein